MDGNEHDPIEQLVRFALREHAFLRVDVGALTRDADLHAHGLTSRASVAVMLALEAQLDLEFTPDRLEPGAFASVARITDLVHELLGHDR